MLSVEDVQECLGLRYINFDTTPPRSRRYIKSHEFIAALSARRRKVFVEVLSATFPSRNLKTVQKPTFNKSAAKQCRLIQLERGNSLSLPNLFTSYSPDLNILDGLETPDFKLKTTSISTSAFDSTASSTTLTWRKQKPSPPSLTEEKSYPGSNPLPESQQSFDSHKAHIFKGHLVPSFFHHSILGIMKKEKAATTTSGKSKKKRPSIFSFFSRKKRTEPKPPSVLEDNESHRGSQLNFDDTPSIKAVTLTPPRSQKTFRAPLPPAVDENKENMKASTSKRLSNASGPSKFSRQSSLRSSRRSQTRRRTSNSKRKKTEENKSINSNDGAPSDPPPPPPVLETFIDDVPSKMTTTRTLTPIQVLSRATEITPMLLETDVEGRRVNDKRPSPVSISSVKSSPKPEEITADMIFTALPPPPKASPKQTKPSPSPSPLPQRKEDDAKPEVPPAVPQSAPPDPVAVATALSFTSSSKQSVAPAVKRLSNFGLSQPKFPPIPVSPFEDFTDSSSESGNSAYTMPVYSNGDVKNQLQLEHRKLLSAFDEWAMLRQTPFSTNQDGHFYANLMVKQEGVLRQHAVVTALYNKLVATVVDNSSPPSTLRPKTSHPRHIINPNSNPPTLGRSTMPSLFKSRSTFDVHAENNNTKQEPERNYIVGNYSPRVTHSKRYSAGDALNPSRPRLGSTEESARQSDERKKYVVEQRPVVRHVPISTLINTTPKLPPIIDKVRQSPQPQKYYTSSPPPLPKQETTYVNEKQYKPVEIKREPIEIKKSLGNGFNTSSSSPKLKTPESPKLQPNNFSPRKSMDSPRAPSPVTTYAPRKLVERPQSPATTYSSRFNHYYANSPPMAKREIQVNGVKHNHPPPIRQYSLPEHVQKPPKMPAPVQTKKVDSIITKTVQKTSPNQPKINGNAHADLMSNISAFPNVTLRSVPKPIEKSFNLGRVLEDGERSRSQYPDPPVETYNKPVMNGSMPAVPPPPPPPAAPILKKAPIRQNSAPVVDADALRGDMLAEIRKAGGIQFLRSTQGK